MSVPTLDEITLLHQNICLALGDPKRILILYVLHEQPRYVSEVAALLDMPQPTVSRHLTILRERGLVIGERAGASVVYSVTDPRLIVVLDTMRQIHREVQGRRSEAVGSL